MDARFRIRTRDGKDLVPGSVEKFSELVRSGEVRPDDLVFDALTGEWAPARSHPMVHLFVDPLTSDSAGSPTADASPSQDVSSRDAPQAEYGPDGEELKLDLVAPQEKSPEEEAQEFMAKMEEERRSDPDLPALFQEAPLVDAKVGSVVGLVPDPPQPAEPAEPTEAAEPAEPAEAARPMEAARPDPAPPPPVREEPQRPSREETEAWASPQRLESRRRRPTSPVYRPRRRINLAMVAGTVVVLVVSVMWPARRAEDAPGEGVAQAGEARDVARTVPVTEEETRALALVAYADAVTALGQELGVGDVPRMWLEGQYLADPAAYPEVREYWERYLDYVDAARGAEVTLYRGAYLMAAADAGLSGPVRSLRLAAAQEDFAATRDQRGIVYRRVEDLALAALDLDALMLELQGRITYEPIAGPRVSAAPVIEAAGTDPEAQALLEGALDRVLEALQGPGGVPTRDRAGVPGWLAEGLQRVERAR